MDIEAYAPSSKEGSAYAGTVNRYVLSGDLLAGRVSRKIARSGEATTEKNYYHLDHQNSTKAVTDETGKPVVQYVYRAFGEQLRRYWDGNANNLTGNEMDDATYTYGGKELDDSTNLYYFNARYYDATTGRFINVDPVQDGSNWYVYCNNNPMNFTDPTGLWIESGWDAVSLGMGLWSLANNIKKGDTLGIVVDSVGIVADTLALLTPVPGGAGAAIKSYNTAKNGAKLASDSLTVVQGVRDTMDSFKNGDTSLAFMTATATVATIGLARLGGTAADNIRDANNVIKTSPAGGTVSFWGREARMQESGMDAFNTGLNAIKTPQNIENTKRAFFQGESSSGEQIKLSCGGR
jgi:RHS repeat-associated protein